MRFAEQGTPLSVLHLPSITELSCFLQDVSNTLPEFLRSSNAELRTALWTQSGKAWESLLHEISDKTKPENNVIVVVGHPASHIALMAHCLRLSEEWLASFHLDTGSISVLDFPDGPSGHGVIRCINYTAHLGRWAIPITRSTQEDEEF